MSIMINVPLFLQPFTNDTAVVEANGSTVGECINYLVKQFPGVKTRLLSKHGDLFGDIIISVNGRSAHPEQLAKPVKDGDKLDILYIIGGG